MIMHQGIDKVQSLIWRIKFYNGERKAHSRPIVLCSGLVTRIIADTACGPLGTAANL